MKKGYLFISNSTKPTAEQSESRDTVKLNFFSIPCIEAAASMGYELNMGVNRNNPEELTASDYDIRFYDSHTYRNIFALRENWTAYRNTCRFLREHPEIKVIHCNTPIGGVIGRLCGKKFGCKVIYTVHGFHFFEGAPIINRTIFKWIEKWLARYTDALITINQEDFEAAQEFSLKPGGKVFKVPGVGVVNSPGLICKSKKDIKESLGFQSETFLCIAVGDLNDNKNFITLLQSMTYFHNQNIGLIICGRGPLESCFKNYISKYGLDERIKLLGFRTDIPELLYASDIFLMSSKREGLPRSTMEAMVAGLPCVVSDIRGNRDLIDNVNGGFLVSPTDAQGFAQAIEEILNDKVLAEKMGAYNQQQIKNFDVDVVRAEMKRIYNEIL